MRDGQALKTEEIAYTDKDMAESELEEGTLAEIKESLSASD